MSIKRLDNVGIVVADLDAAASFFTDLGMTVVGSVDNSGEWVDGVVGLSGVRSRITMLETPDGHSRIELAQYQHPPAEQGVGAAPANTLGLHRVAFAVHDLEESLAVVRAHGGDVLGQVEQYEQSYLLCYTRGPEGIIVMLAQELN